MGSVRRIALGGVRGASVTVDVVGGTSSMVVGVMRRARMTVGVVRGANRGMVMMVEVMMEMRLRHHRGGESERKQHQQRSVFHDRSPSTQHYSSMTMPHAISRAAKINFFPQMNRE